LTWCPRIESAAGTSEFAAMTAVTTVTAAPTPMSVIQESPKTTSEATESTTIVPAKMTARPPVAVAIATESATSRPAPSSWRNRVTRKSE